MASALKNSAREACLPRKAADTTHPLASSQITYKQAINWAQAVDFARVALKRPFTVEVRIQWLLAPSSMPEPERVKTLLNDIAIWIRRRTQHSVVWVYYRDGGTKTGVNVNLFVHVPPSLIDAFTIALTGWIKPRTDSFDPRAVRVNRVSRLEIDAMKSFIIDGSDEQLGETCGVLSHHIRNPVSGKRLGISHSINAPARTRYATLSDAVVEHPVCPT